MKTKFAAIIGMILVMTSAALPVQAAAAVPGAGISQSGTAAEGASYADRTDEFRYLKNGWHFRDGNWYYVRGGKAVTGWVKYTGKWYFLDKNGEMKSRIVPYFEGDIVTSPRSQAYYMCTEYGVVNLVGCCTWERAERLISVAHPDFREDLIKAAERQRIWRRSNRLPE